jgi:hypothetical protein
MKDKEKQIEEMAKVIAKRDCYFYDKCNRKPKHNCISLDPKIRLDSDKNYVTIATWLVNAGYQKTPDSVVLSREEYEELLKVNKADLAEQANYTRKETTEKILNDVADCMKTFEDDDDGYILKRCEFKFFMREIAKQFGVEIKE